MVIASRIIPDKVKIPFPVQEREQESLPAGDSRQFQPASGKGGATLFS
jgi:hypothetical protein